MESLTISYFDGMGRGLMTLKNIALEQKVLSIPSQLIFSKQNLIFRRVDDKVLNKISTIYSENSENAVIAWLLLEKSRGNASFFKPYIDILPKHVPSLIHFSLDELFELQSEEIIKAAQEMQLDTKLEFDNFRKGMSPHWPYNINDVTFEDYKWAVSVVSSRGLRFRGEVYLAPVADMFNYAPTTTKREANGGEQFLKYHKLNSNGSITILSDREAAQGTQLFEDYGDNNDDLYLQHHGFVASKNPFTCVRIDGSVIKKILPLSQAQLHLLHLFEIRLEPNSFKCIDKSTHLGKALEIFVAVAAFDDDAVQNCKSIIQAHPRKWSKILADCSINSISEYLYFHKDLDKAPHFGVKALQVLRSAITVGIISFLKTSPEEDRQMLVECDSQLATCRLDSSAAATAAAPVPATVAANCTEETQRSLGYKSLALQYRLQKKNLWLQICRKFDHIGCWPSVEAAPANSTVAPLQSGIPELEDKVHIFNQWFRASKPSHSKIEAAVIPGFRIGAVAVEDVAAESPYLGVPTAVIMDSEVAYRNSSVTGLIERLFKKFRVRDDFHELLLFLIHETFVLGQESKYWPYLQLLPKLHELNIPLIWPNSTLQARLAPSHLLPEVVRYRSRVHNRFNSLIEISIITDFFPAGIFTWESYLWATVILDSRSIWWNGKRHLVPMLDFINCAENPADGKRVHSTRLDESEKFAVTNAGSTF